MNMNLLCVILFAVVLMLVGVCLRQRRVIHNKNRAIVKFIDESIKYKELYYSRVTRGRVTRGQEPCEVCQFFLHRHCQSARLAGEGSKNGEKAFTS